MTLPSFPVIAMAVLVLGATSPPPVVPPSIGFTIRGVDDDMDLHGNPSGADLVIFAAGNQWMVLPDLLAAFQKTHPEVRNIFYETLPPGILAEQMAPGATLRVGELLLDVRPDVYLAGKGRMAQERDAGLVGEPTAYATNDLAIMVRSGNPKHITSLRDLGRPDVRVAMPNPQTEGIAKQIEGAYSKAGGSALVQAIMDTKLRDGTTLLTRIHHRETPIWILDGKADAGPVWISEALYQERIHSGIETVRIPAQSNVLATYQAAETVQPEHEAAAKAFVSFLTGDTAQAIYRSYGFTAATPAKEKP
ncbi:MAG: substrate-binding domain-containing protein [Candidatus Baltobacteraceae bacterium]